MNALKVYNEVLNYFKYPIDERMEIDTRLKIGISQGVGRNSNYLYPTIKYRLSYDGIADLHREKTLANICQESIRIERYLHFDLGDSKEEQLFSSCIFNYSEILRFIDLLRGMEIVADFYFKLNFEFREDGYLLSFNETESPVNFYEISRELDDARRHLKEISKKPVERLSKLRSKIKSEFEEKWRRRNLIVQKRKKSRFKSFPSLTVTTKRNCDPEESFTYSCDDRSLYLMKDESSDGIYKIGVSNNPQYRESTLQKEKPTVTLLKSFCGLSCFERDWHRKFSKQRIRGEWFKLEPFQVQMFCKINQKSKNEISLFLSN